MIFETFLTFMMIIVFLIGVTVGITVQLAWTDWRRKQKKK